MRWLYCVCDDSISQGFFWLVLRERIDRKVAKDGLAEIATIIAGEANAAIAVVVLGVLDVSKEGAVDVEFEIIAIGDDLQGVLTITFMDAS